MFVISLLSRLLTWVIRGPNARWPVGRVGDAIRQNGQDRAWCGVYEGTTLEAVGLLLAPLLGQATFMYDWILSRDADRKV